MFTKTLEKMYNGIVRLDMIYKLSDDYQEIFINNASKTYMEYEPLLLSSRTIHKDTHDDIFILEPHKFYKISFKLYNKNNKEYIDDYAIIDLNKKFVGTGLIISENNIDVKNRVMYMYNASENMIMIKDKFVIGDWHL